MIRIKALSFAPKIFASLSFAVFAASASAQLIGVSGASDVPPAIFGGFEMTVFGDDVRPNFGNENNVISPFGGVVSFSAALSHREVGAGWLTWSHGYTGDVYFSPSSSSLTLTLPSFTSSFYFYAEPDDRGDYAFSVSSDGTVLSEIVNGNGGAEFFGFYTTDNSAISTITISSNDVNGFAIGEFGIARAVPVPEPSAYVWFGAAGLCGLITARRFRRKIA